MLYVLKIRMLNRWYPKYEPEAGAWQKVRVKVLDYIKTDENFTTEYGQITLTGQMPCLIQGVDYEVHVEQEIHEKYGMSYGVRYCRELRQFETKQQKIDFLRMFLTDRQIHALFQVGDPIQLLETKNILEMSNAVGIGEATAQKMIDRYEACKDYGPAYGELGSYGLTTNMINKLIENYGSPDTALEKVKNNPYILAEEIKGIGFAKADEMALNVGISKHDVRRARAFISFHMNETAEETGSSYMTYDELLDAIDETLGADMPQTSIDKAMQQLIDKDVLWYTDRNRGDYIETIIALKKNYNIERKIAYHVKRILDGPNNIGLEEDDVNELVLPQEQKQGWQFTEQQKDGIKAIIRSNIVIIRGYGGTGKSSSVAGLLSCLDEEYTFAQCALSGKASVNLRDITGKNGSTIHTLLGYNPEGGFKHNERDPLMVDMVILDEASMVDIGLFLSLISAIKTGSKLVLLGDTNQLEAIGVGNVLMDLIDSEMVPVITFDKIHRQGAKSGIIPFSIQIAQGKTKYKDGWVGEETLGELQDLTVVGYKHDKTSQEERASTQLIIQHFKKMYRRCKDISQIAVVVPTRANGTGCYKLNQLIQDIVLPTRRGPGIQLGTKNQPFTVYKGDKVINLVNNYEVKPNIFNGNMGEIVEIDIENKKVVVDFYNIGLVEMKGKNLDNLDLGYAITCHKAQGSTIPYLIYCLDYSHFVMLNRQQAYTGITRAKKQAVLIIETKAFNRAVRTNHVVHKRTFLYHFLVGELEING